MNKIVCKDCGFETDCGNDFCPNCGHKLVLPNAPHGNVASQVPPDILMTAPPTNPVRTQIKITKPVIFAAVAVLAIIIAISAGVSYANDPVNMIISELQDKNFNVAIEMYHEQIKRSDMERLEGRLIKRFEAIQDEFLNERMEYMDATSELNTIREFSIEGLSDKVNESAIYIDELNNSRSAFNLAEEQFAAKDYPNAMDSYRRVIDRDKNYNDAQAKLTEAVELYKGDLFTTLTDMENNEMFEDIISRLNAALVVLPDDDEIASKITYYNDLKQTIAEEFVLERITEINANTMSSRDYDSGITDLKGLLAEYPAFETEIGQEIDSFTTALMDMVEIELVSDSIILENGMTSNLAYTTVPANLKNLELTWDSSDVSVASVNSEGLITASGFGTADIRALTPDGTLKAECSVRINPILGKDITAYQSEDIAFFSDTESVNMMGAEYMHGFMTNDTYDDGRGKAYFNLDGKYTSMSGLYGPIAHNRPSYNVTLIIWGDEEMLASYEMAVGDLTKIFSLDVTGVNQLMFEFSPVFTETKMGSYEERYGVANVILSTEEAVQAQLNNPIGIYNSNPILGRDIKAYRLRGTDEFSRAEPGLLMGKSYDNGFSAKVWGDIWWTFRSGDAYYNINNKYTSLSGLYGPLDGTSSGAATMEIWGDGEMLDTFEVQAGDSARTFTVDVSGITLLGIRFILSDTNPRDATFGVANMELS